MLYVNMMDQNIILGIFLQIFHLMILIAEGNGKYKLCTVVSISLFLDSAICVEGFDSHDDYH